MSESPSKRRKTSPTTSVAVGTPNLRNRNAPTPSFASPTRASEAKRGANLERRGLSPAKELAAPISTGKNLDNLFAKALGDERPSIEGQDEGVKSATTIGGGLAAKPRRMSKSPSKSIRNVERTSAPPVDLEGVANPFQKKGLRRSPVGSKVGDVAPVSQPVEEEFNPFQRRGLRRSPMGSQPSQASQISQSIRPSEEQREQSQVQRSILQARSPEPFSTTPPGLPPARALQNTRSPPTEQRLQSPKPQAAETVRKSTRKEVARPAPLFELNVSLPEAQVLSEPLQQPDAVQTNATTATRAAASEVSTANQPRSPGTVTALPLERAERASNVDTKKPKTADRPSKDMTTLSSRSTSTRPVLQSPRSEEPELPPTPTQLGLADPVVTTPPSGIHNTPSKRERARLKKALKSSPLKPRDERPLEEAVEKPNGPAEDITSKQNAPLSRPALRQLDSNTKEKPQRRKSARFLVPEDPYAEKKKERDSLLEELKQLQSDVKLANQETERLRLRRQNTSKKAAKSLALSDPDAVLAMLLRSTAEVRPQPPSESQPKSIFNSINAFLPFRSRRKTTSALSSKAQQSLEKPLPSMLPLAQADPLPFLQAFSPLHYTQTITLLPPTPSEGSSTTLQLEEHLISAYHPSQLFHANVSLVVNTANHSVHNLEILRLDPAAEHELGAFLHDKAKAKELSVVGWAMGRWAEVNIARAKFWCTIHNEFSSPKSVQPSIQRFQDRGKKRKRANSVPVGAETDASGRVWTRKDIMMHMGRTNYEISNDNAVLRIEWEIKFDWTGEVKNCITALAKLPESCKLHLHPYIPPRLSMGRDKENLH